MRELPKDYFLGVDDELVDYLEKQGEETIREIHLSNKTNVENGYKLLNIQIVGIGSSFLLLTQKTNFDFLTAGITTFTLLWTWCAIYLVCTGLSVKVRGLINALLIIYIMKNIRIWSPRALKYSLMQDI
ncbi:hypothetical protein RCU78_12270 [Escherichia marmotae]|uniref:hypothetical protein n=1 Tax=Escherichia marmotae TaxID=1499973 RepID=UPI0028903018|nr:hypothetical protein [Escherichia marmotae]MDZ5480863.1 hypothetical protein [Escherichia marmotae]MED0193035.1 hypothetical protein [Escherichia marmotae]MED0227704.1 hypothetical protein [Escherichia marmotae]MED0238368.1 hypothetical protein [Escherichia marmotae]MED0597241.1 hypothetical protein [Escherichia marmotae]